jgi:hypothetical protein
MRFAPLSGSTAMIYKNYRRLVKPDEAAAFWDIFPRGTLEGGPAEGSRRDEAPELPNSA